MRSLLFVVAVFGCTSGSGGGDNTWSQHATQIAVSGRSACALEDDGRVACWGTSSVLQRNDVITGGASIICTDPFVPSSEIGVFCANPFGMRVKTDVRFVEISADQDTYCGRTAEGAVHCWPFFYTGTNPEVTDYSKSVEVSGTTKFTSISGSTHGFIGIAMDGRAYKGTLGAELVALPGDHQFTQVRTGEHFWAGIDTAGTIYEGELANTDPPQQIAPIVGATHLAIGGSGYYRNGCATDAESHVWCWGPGVWGELGDGTFTYRTEPAPIVGGGTYKDVATSGVHVCAVTTGGGVDCWGWNARGESGPTMQSCPDPASAGTEWPCTDHPVHIALPLAATSVRVGPVLSCALLEDRTVWCWGKNSAGQLGRGSVGADSQVAEQVQ